jgi:hypothetical protein
MIVGCTSSEPLVPPRCGIATAICVPCAESWSGNFNVAAGGTALGMGLLLEVVLRLEEILRCAQTGKAACETEDLRIRLD